MKLLVVGGTHFVGRHAVEQAVETGTVSITRSYRQ